MKGPSQEQLAARAKAAGQKLDEWQQWGADNPDAPLTGAAVANLVKAIRGYTVAREHAAAMALTKGITSGCADLIVKAQSQQDVTRLPAMNVLRANLLELTRYSREVTVHRAKSEGDLPTIIEGALA